MKYPYIRGALVDLWRGVAGQLRTYGAVGRQIQNGAGRLEAGQPHLALARQLDERRHQEAVAHPLAVEPRAVGVVQRHRDPVHDVERVLDRDRAGRLPGLVEHLREAAAEDELVGHVADAALEVVVDDLAEGSAAQGRAELLPALTGLPKTFSIDAGAVEEA